MWCYQKPGFETLLLAELQRQQQSSQFCDTLLKTEGVSVPAHSCILSAISPHISSALSSTPLPPAGQSHLLEFQALGSCTLLHMVRLLYSGEMAGEGEKEKQEAISAAAKLGIHGLVEVTRRDRKSRHEEGEGRHAEVGVQTELLMPEENEGRRGRWRREVRDGSTFMWLSDGEKDTRTQTEELQLSTAPSHPAASFETIDMAALQNLGQTDPHFPPSQIPYIPISLVYPQDENQTYQSSSAPMDSMQESTAAGHTSITVLAPPYTSAPPSLLPFSSQATLCGADPQSWWAGPQTAVKNVAAAEEWKDERFEQYQGNIPGYINYFLNPEKEEGSRRGRARRRRSAGVGDARRAGTGERGARRPRAKTAGRGRGALTQKVDVQEVGVSRLQKLFLQRWGMRVPRTGQGGGAAGRKLYLKTRELLKSAKSCQRRRGRSKVWKFSPSGDVLPYSDDGVPVGRAQRARAKPTTSVSFSSPNTQLYSVRTGVLSHAASYVSPASSLHHTSLVPPLASAPHEAQPEHFDRLLEEVMIGLDVSANNNGAPHSQPPLTTSSSSCTHASSYNTLAQNKQQDCFTRVVDVARLAGVSGSANSEASVLQQGEEELNAMLENLLQSFEQHVGSCTAKEDVEMGAQSCTEAPVRSSQTTEQQQNDEAVTPARLSQPRKASAHSAPPPRHTEGTQRKVSAPAKQRKKRRKNEYPLSLEKKRAKVRKPSPPSNTKTKIVCERGEEQLRQMPVVKLERSGLLPAKVKLHCQSVEVKSLAKTKATSSSVKRPHDSLSDKNQPVSWCTKTYPIRSRCREAQMDSMAFLVESVRYKQPPLAHQPSRRQGRPKKNVQLPGFSDGESSAPPIQQQHVDEQLEKNQERHEEESTVQPQEEAEGATRTGKKRGAVSEEETSDDTTVAKRACLERMPQPTFERCTTNSDSADFEPATIETEDIIDVETVSLSSAGDCFQREEQDEKPAGSETKLRESEESSMNEELESSGDEIIDVDGDVEDVDCQKEAEKDNRQSRTAPTLLHCVVPSVSSPSPSEGSLGSTGTWDKDKYKDIDVIGGSSPVPKPVVISWTDCSEGEKDEGDEDVDISGEKTDCYSSAVLATMSKGELVNSKYQTEVLLH